MSEPSTQSTTYSFSDFERLFNDVLVTYTNKTGKDLFADPLASNINRCDSPDAILAVLLEALALDGSRSDDFKISKWLQFVVRGLYALPAGLALGVGSHNVRRSKPAIFLYNLSTILHGLFPTKVILSALGVLLNVRISYAFSNLQSVTCTNVLVHC
jgi:hypothetical protein